MHKGRLRLGLALGLLGAFAYQTVSDTGPAARAHGPLLADCEGGLRSVVIQYVPDAAAFVLPTYRAFLRQLPATVTVHVLCPEPADFRALAAAVGTTRCRLEPCFTHHPMTAWSRDRWLAFAPASASGPTVLLTPGEESAEALWPQRAGDKRLAGDLANASTGAVRAERSLLAFDGGDFVADRDTVFVTARVLPRNLGRTVESAAHLRAHLEHRAARRVVLLEEGPDHHAGMFMMPIGERTMLVADPSLARDVLGTDDRPLPLEADWTPATQARFDAVAARCRAEGYRVVRVPVVPGRDGRRWLTWLNVILDREEERRVVYMPVFDAVEALNAAAADVWRRAGFAVRRVDCTATVPHFGSLRCLVNVLSRA